MNIKLKSTPGASFEAVMSQRSYKSEKIAWIVATVAVAMAAISGVTVMVLLPLKQAVPYMVYVDKATGVTQVISVIDARTVSNDEVNAQYWLARYVTARESYFYKLLQQDYDLTIALSEAGVGREYSAIFEGTPNKATRLGDVVEERIRIITAQPTPGVAGRGSVRFEKTTWRIGLREPEKTEIYTADIAYEWRSISGWENKDLLKNPLGFTVTAYRATPEIAFK